MKYDLKDSGLYDEMFNGTEMQCKKEFRRMPSLSVSPSRPEPNRRQ